MSNARGSVGGFNDSGKKGRCACPGAGDVVGIQLELEEQARLLELLLVVAHTTKQQNGLQHTLSGPMVRTYIVYSSVCFLLTKREHVHFSLFF